jgi:hypothetical protein
MRMLNALRTGTSAAIVALSLFPQPAGACPVDSVQSGTVCIDKYESSVWYVPLSETTLITKIQRGTVTAADLTSPAAVAAGVHQLGLTYTDLADAGCPVTGNRCIDFYAVSIADVFPSTFITWFQAVAVARNSLKRLATNQEWQAAALGTGVGLRAPCNIYSDAPMRTGSLPGCVSDVGAFDMVGNVQEMVAEWGVRGADCTTWPAAFGSDYACFGAAPVLLPAYISRGGSFNEGTGAGVFAATTKMGPPSSPDYAVGLRCVR